jgi:hypothetical protein
VWVRRTFTKWHKKTHFFLMGTLSGSLFEYS